MGHRIAWTAFCALCAVNFAAAQIVVGTPACTQSCLNQSLQASGVSQACAGSDAGCLCNNQGYAAASVECFHSTCSLNDERTGLEAIEDACRQLLVARLPKKPNEPGQFHGFDTTEVSAFTTYLQQEALLAGLVSNPLVAALTADSTGASPPGAGAPPPGVAAAAPTTSKTNAGSPPTASPVGTGSTSTTTSGSTGALNQLTVALSFAASRLLSNADRDALLAAVKTYTSAKNVTLSLGSTEKFFASQTSIAPSPAAAAGAGDTALLIFGFSGGDLGQVLTRVVSGIVTSDGLRAALAQNSLPVTSVRFVEAVAAYAPLAA